jgi:hypothetical protein
MPVLSIIVSIRTDDHARRGLTRRVRAYPWRMDALTLFGLVAVSLMLIFYALEDQSPWCILAFAGACALGSIYGFLQGAWPFGLVEAIWAGVAGWRWRRASTKNV